jgi:hypothetical protein
VIATDAKTDHARKRTAAVFSTRGHVSCRTIASAATNPVTDASINRGAKSISYRMLREERDILKRATAFVARETR